ncbi:trafficking protein particle complex subunit 10 [Crucibulum laeve]|uniref:Trafficking protein particle complex subunit 10 n=1 Tax=Crucibulum laeve TaxID=68775 RepID=A0A5C3MCV7_9AGAR|nr:trafficking protein particle complex subunit 10 [Crucibulum laeve]
MAAQPQAAGHRVLVSYTAPQSFLSSPNWPKVHAAIAAQLPLRNIHWKSTSKSSVRTIQELDVYLVPLETLRDEHTSQIPVTLLEKPLINVYVVHCEDHDLETYRSVVKKQVKDWHSTVSTRRNQEWLILQIIRPEARAPTGNFFQIKGSVLDKLKADFNTDKRDRCVQVTWVSGNENPLAFAEFANKMKDGILSAFDLAVAQRQEEVKRSEGQQQMPGWNFCTFFILKESLAASYEGMNLLDEALTQYEELEESFYHVWKERNMSWFGPFISAGPNDDSLPLLSVTKKPYRDLILANTITVFDFRIYLLARQCEVLAKIGFLGDVTNKVTSFLGTFGTRLLDAELSLAPFFIQSWKYSSALSVVEQCDKWVTTYKLESAKTPAFNAGKGELLEIARTQLDLIGLKCGHLPERPPFSVSSSRKSRNSTSGGKISNPELLKAIDDRDAFYELYVGTTNRAIDMYAKAGRRKFALKLHGSLAALDLHRGRLASALTTYTSLPAHYAPHMWTSLESYMLSRALDTHATLDKSQDVEWIHILLSFLKTYCEHRGTDLLLHEEDKLEYVSKLVNAMREAASQLENGWHHYTILLDGSYIDVTVQNRLPCVGTFMYSSPFLAHIILQLLPADQVNVTLAGRDSDKLRFISPIEGLPPGKTDLTLFCPTPSSGIFLLESTEIRVAHLLLQYVHKKQAPKGPSTSKQNFPVLVRIPQDLHALDLQISQSHRIELGRASTLTVIVTTGRNDVSRMSVKLSAPGISFRCQETVLGQDHTVPSFEATEDAVVLLGIPEDKTVSFSVPHSDASAFHAMKVTLDVEYTTEAEPSIQRCIRFSRVLVTTLPISVNVEDFFRGKRLISKFTVSTTSHQHVRIAAATLDAPEAGLEGVTIKSCSAKSRGVVTVTPVQPANFLFALDSTNGPVRESLTLYIKYHMLREEVESLIEEQVREVLDDSPSQQEQRVMLVKRLVEALERDATWVDMYGITGELVVPEMLEEDPEINDLLVKITKLLRSHRHSETPDGEWREIRIPVDVPYMNIIAAARIRITSVPFTGGDGSEQKPILYAGQPISAVLTIRTSFHWGSSPGEKTRKYMMRFNVEEMVREWLVSGPKRGDFIAVDDGTHTVPITLIALHHGEFSLPKVTVTALPMPGEVTMGSMAVPSTETYQVHGAEKVLVLPRGGRSTFVVGMGSG